MKSISMLAGLLVMFSCQTPPGTSEIRQAQLHLLNTPCEAGGQPHLLSTGTHTFLSWIEYENDTTDALMCSQLVDGNWASPVKISQGHDWFVNWADFPMLHSFGDNQSLAAHWLAKSDTGVYHYDVMVSISRDLGKTWSSPMVLHNDSVKAEHGFVSMQALGNGLMQAIWLDGRHTGTGHDQGTGAMTLRGAIVDVSGTIRERVEIDDRVCDCCQTSLTMTSMGPLAVYRDRSEEEVRDISFVRKVNGRWTNPQAVHEDNWLIAGCPVNGPQVISGNSNTIVTWFTQADDVARVNLSVMDLKNELFLPPVRIDNGKPLGRVDLTWINDESATCFVVWLEQIGDFAEIRGRKVVAGEPTPTVFTLTEASASRSSGFPSVIQFGDALLLAWTEVDEASYSTMIRTAFVEL